MCGGLKRGSREAFPAYFVQHRVKEVTMSLVWWANPNLGSGRTVSCKSVTMSRVSPCHLFGVMWWWDGGAVKCEKMVTMSRVSPCHLFGVVGHFGSTYHNSVKRNGLVRCHHVTCFASLSLPLSLGIDYKFQQWGVGGVGQGALWSSSRYLAFWLPTLFASLLSYPPN